jgi:membrane protease YdiL (CAAX protease family)
LQIVVREQLTGPAFMTTVPMELTPDVRAIDVDLRTLAWTRDNQPSAPPARAAMLRLRLQLPVGEGATLNAVNLRADPDLPAPRAVRPRENDTLSQWLVPAVQADAGHLPWLVPPPTLRAEHLLAWRDAARAAVPGVIVGGKREQAMLPAWASQRVAAGITVAYALGLLWLWRRPRRHPRLRAVLEAGGILAGPLWLLAGLHLGTPDIPLPAIAFAAGLLFAMALGWRQRHDPYETLTARTPERWLGPFLMLPIAGLLLLAGPPGWTQPPVGHVFFYIAWALTQQWLMLAMVGRRLRVAWPAPIAVFVTAMLFALLHAPNGALMQLCLVAELWWGWCYIRSRNLLAIGLAHAGCALMLEAGMIGGPWLRSLEVSARFFI